MRVLLVDDDQDITATLKRGLETHGYQVNAYNRPTEVSNEEANQCDIAILDIKMPEINGFELARKLWRQNERLQVCFLSAFDINENEAKATLPNLKTHCFITKPKLPSEIASHIQTHFVRLA